MKDTFIVHTSLKERFKSFSTEQFGELFICMLDYQATGQIPKIEDSLVELAFNFVRVDMDSNNQKYEAKCEKMRELGRRGGLAKASKSNQELANASESQQKVAIASESYQELANASNGYQRLANVADNDNDNDNENDNDNDLNNISSISSDIDSSDLGQSDIPASEDKGLIEELKAEVEEIHVKQVVAEFNRVCSEMPKVSKISVQRNRKVKSRLKTFNVDDIFKAFDIASKSKFLNGHNDTGWKATFDWFFENDNNLTKVLEGNYNNSSSSKTGFNSFNQRDYDMKELEKKMFNTG